jgi:hypothetical protein
MKTLRQLYDEHTGKVTDKWGLYLDVYDRAFSPFRHRPVSVVEIGVQNGGSLEVWSRYFPAARAIVGCDVNPLCAELRFEDPRISVIVAPANSPEAARAILKLAAPIDIFIDDGSHTTPDIVASFCNYFPFVSPGGVYAIEDLHCAYIPEYEGGIAAPSSMGFLKLLVDGLHHHVWKAQASFSALAQPFLPPGVTRDASLVADVASVAFHDSLCVIEKGWSRGAIRLGKRVVAGTQATVTPEALAPDRFDADRKSQGT